MAEVLSQYLPSLQLLQRYDEGDLPSPGDTAPRWQLTYDQARGIINELAAKFLENTLFGQERSEGLRGILDAIYQSFAGKELYLQPSKRLLTCCT